MPSQYKNQDCINLILEELKIDANFLPFEEEGLINYFEKIDNNAAFKKFFSEVNWQDLFHFIAMIKIEKNLL